MAGRIYRHRAVGAIRPADDAPWARTSRFIAASAQLAALYQPPPRDDSAHPGLRPSASTPRRCRPCRRRPTGCASSGASRPRRGRRPADPARTSRRCSRRRAPAVPPLGNGRPSAPRAARSHSYSSHSRAPGTRPVRSSHAANATAVLVRHRRHRELRPVLLRAPRPVLVAQPVAGLGAYTSPRRLRQLDPPPPRPAARSSASEYGGLTALGVRRAGAPRAGGPRGTRSTRRR